MKPLLLSCLIFLTLCSRSQTDFHFADSTAQWNVFVFSDQVPNTNTNNYVVWEDVVWQNKQYQNIMGTLYRRDSLNRIYTPHPYDTAQSDGIMYDFGANVGDTVSFKRLLPGYTWFPGTLIVDSTDTVNWDKPRRRLFLQTLNGMDGEVWIDGIGALYADPLMHILQYNPPGPGSNAIYNLLCFHENGQLVYQDPNYNSCNTELNEPAQVKTKVFPNPADDLVTFQLPGFSGRRDLRLEITNLNGRQVISTPFQASSIQIGTASLPRGIYFYSVVKGPQRLATGKLVLQ